MSSFAAFAAIALESDRRAPDSWVQRFWFRCALIFRKFSPFWSSSTKGRISAIAPTITREPGWTFIHCDDPIAFEEWLGVDEMGFPQDEDSSLGSHLLVELYGCPHELLDSVQNVGQAMRQAADDSEATTVATSFHEFEPYGVSGAVIIQESHYTIHTWPEHEYAAVDLFYCGGTVKVHKAIEVMRDRFRPTKMKFLVVRRGLKSEVEGAQ